MNMKENGFTKAKLKGKFITLAGSMMSLYKKEQTSADQTLYAITKQHWNELDPEGWYDTSTFNMFLEAYAKTSVAGVQSIVTLGKNIYPTVKRNLRTPAG